MFCAKLIKIMIDKVNKNHTFNNELISNKLQIIKINS